MNYNYFNEKEKYYLNSQKYSECQLVTAINAAIYLDEYPVLQNSIEYERLVDLVCARIGAAINIDTAHKYLRLQKTNIDDLSLDIVKQLLADHHPIDASIHHKKTGRHSILIMDVNEKTNEVRILNAVCLTKNTWIKWAKLKKYLTGQHSYLSLDYWYVRRLQYTNIQIYKYTNNGNVALMAMRHLHKVCLKLVQFQSLLPNYY